MFKIGDLLKIKMDQFEYQYGGCANTTVYKTLKKTAEQYRYKVLSKTAGSYELERSDGQVDTKSIQEVHQLLELVTSDDV